MNEDLEILKEATFEVPTYEGSPSEGATFEEDPFTMQVINENLIVVADYKCLNIYQFSNGEFSEKFCIPSNHCVRYPTKIDDDKIAFFSNDKLSFYDINGVFLQDFKVKKQCDYVS